jgi:hypothetical protein
VLLETVTAPINNPVTGGEVKASVELPEGMESKKAETARATVLRSTGPVAYEWANCHSSLADVVQTERGLAR